MAVGKGPLTSQREGHPCLLEALGEGDEEGVCGQGGPLTLSPWGRVLQIKAHQYRITGCCLSPYGRLLATVCLGGALKVRTRGLWWCKRP